MKAIEVRELTKRFRHITAVDGVSLDVEPGSVYALIGSNGAGKSTLIRMLLNVLPPTSGGARVLGMDCHTLAGDGFQRIAYVAEDQEQPEWMTVGELLAYCRPFYPAWDEALAADLVRQFALPLDRKLKHLSRGMRMKAVLASSLAYRPQLIVLDEPFGGLDPLVRDEFVESLIERAPETTILISSHDLAEIEHFATHVGFMEEGRLAFSEELASLAARMREVEVTFADPPVLPTGWPASWLNPEVSGVVLRFVETAFEAARTAATLASLLSARPQHIDYRPLSLRGMFLALARSARRAQGGAA